ncbi:hypothetical protein HMI54_013997 [Coelomomyces lativittatus]|nr:hypothetical protein HMI56_002711 [Coelomomyces lativittatus]KAJ1514529.1 hypothetical protein HMI54_013997 [Coelomomyces lativittatus]
MDTINFNDAASFKSESSSFSSPVVNPGTVQVEKNLKQSTTGAMKEKQLIKDDAAVLAPYFQYARDVIYWESPIVTGLVLAGSILSVSLTHLFWDNLMSIGCGFVFAVTLINFIYVASVYLVQTFSGSVFHNPNSERIQNVNIQWTEQDVIFFSRVLSTMLNSFLRPASRFVMVDDFVTTIKGLFALYCVWSLASFFSTTAFIFFTIFTLFSVPLLYKQHKEQIHVTLNTFESKMNKSFVQACTFTNNLRVQLFEKMKQTKSNLTKSSTPLKKEE